MIVDAKLDFKRKELVLWRSDGTIDRKLLVDPYFYLIVPSSFKKQVEIILESLDVVIEELPKTPIIWNGNKYVPSSQHVVLKVSCQSPNQIPEIVSKIHQLSRKIDVRVSAHNVRYIVRNTFDHNVMFFDGIPLYYGFDSKIIDKISNVKLLIIDVEVIDGKPKLASCYIHKPFTPVNKDDVVTLELPSQVDELLKLVNDASIITGFNLLGFDIPVLKRCGINISSDVKPIFDVVLTLTSSAQSFQIGSARSLLDVAITLKEKVGITDEEIEIKRNSRKILKSNNWNEIVKYNINDIVLTAKILDPIFGYCASLSAYTQIPLSEIQQLTVGTIAEYFLLRFCELNGYVPEYTLVNVELKHPRVYVEAEVREYENVAQFDIKMMYPSFVLANFIDPTLIVDKDKFDRKVGIGIMYSAVKRLAVFRTFTKKLKKSNPKYEPMDLGVKALINALSYGVCAKSTGYSIMGNPITPSKIFYGTVNVQFSTINYLKEQGIKVIYGDTDSFFIELKGKSVNEIHQMINQYLSQYGLEVDLEDVWDRMYIYSAKNYILKKGDKIVIKGGALKNLKKFYLPECINIYELLRIDDKEERLKYISEVIHSCEVHELFSRIHQQVWRLIGKDYQSVKKAIASKIKEYTSKNGLTFHEAKSLASRTYIRVLTPWVEKPVIYLKKLAPYMIARPDSAPIVQLYINYGEVVDLEKLSAHDIVEMYCIKTEDLKLRNIEGELLVWNEDLYSVKINSLTYVVKLRDREIEIPANYHQLVNNTYSLPPIARLEKLKLNFEVRKVEIEKNALRNAVQNYVKTLLRKYNIL